MNKKQLDQAKNNGSKSATGVRCARGLGAALIALTANSLAFGYVETVDGDLSGDINAPTFIPLSAVTPISGTMGGGDFDIATFTVGASQSLVGLTIDSWAGPTGVSFWGLVSGSTWSTGLGGGVSAGALLDFGLFSDADIGSNQLSTPLGPGDYTLLIQDTGAPHDYGITLSAVPIPGAAWLFGSALAGFFGLRARGR